MNSQEIFEYSDNFLNELINELIRLKTLKLSSPKNNDFDLKLKSILGKNSNENEFKNLSVLDDALFKKKLEEKFENMRKERLDILGEEQSKELEKRIFLQSIDMNWKSHIQYLEQLRQVIGLRSYGQRDPLIEYKKEAFNLFETLLNKLKLDFLMILMNLKVVRKPIDKSEEFKPKKIDPKYVGKK